MNRDYYAKAMDLSVSYDLASVDAFILMMEVRAILNNFSAYCLS